jgi:hypothetical protein
MRYGVQVQLIPDRTNGDGGLEAYVSAGGIAYQCYAPQDPLSIDAQTTGQKRKIRADTQKLIDRSSNTVKLIGEGNTIKEWVLLTPTFGDKSLVEYAHNRATEIRNVASDHFWCHDEFRISVQTDGLFAKELAALASVKRGVLGLSDVSELPAPQLDDGQPFEQTLRDKLLVEPALSANTTRLDQYVAETLGSYFRGAVEMERLSRVAPTTFRAIEDCAGIVFEGLAGAFVENDAKQLVVVGSLREDLARKLQVEASGLQPPLAELLARFFVASWWLQCPLYLDPVDTDAPIA